MSDSEDRVARDICGRAIYRTHTPTYRVGMREKSSGFYVGYTSGWLSFDEVTEEVSKRNVENDHLHHFHELIPPHSWQRTAYGSLVWKPSVPGGSTT